MTDEPQPAMSRRSLFALIGSVAGSAVMYEAMSSLAYAAESSFTGPPGLSGDAEGRLRAHPGRRAWRACAAAYELRKAGYKVQILEYQDRAGGRNWSLHGGDTYTELGGFTQKCEFDKGLYINPGPWRIPYHHHGILHYCQDAGRSDAAVHPGRLQRLRPLHAAPSAASRSASVTSRPTSTATSPSCWPSRPASRRSTRR